MKAVFLTMSLFLLLVTLGACSGGGAVIANSTGAPGEIIVVMNKKQWDGPAGDALKDVLKSKVPGLPQPEPVLTVSYAEPQNFNGMLKVVRNILIAEIDPAMYTKAGMTYTKDKWARNQQVLKIQAPDAASFELFITQHAREIVDFYVKAEFKRTQALLKNNYNHESQKKIKEMFDVEMSIPEDQKFSKDTTDFFWVTNNANTGRRDIIVYSFPYTDKNTFTKEYMIAKRDSVLKANIPGAFPDSYMTTENRFGTEYTPLEVNGKYVGELRGLWKMVGDMMGGPFVSHARLDEKNQRVIVAEGFVYAPETSKRNYIRQLEAALYTLQLPGDKPVEEEVVAIEEDK